MDREIKVFLEDYKKQLEAKGCDLESIHVYNSMDTEGSDLWEVFIDTYTTTGVVGEPEFDSVCVEFLISKEKSAELVEEVFEYLSNFEIFEDKLNHTVT